MADFSENDSLTLKVGIQISFKPTAKHNNLYNSVFKL